MILRVLVILGLCCTILCAFVGYLSRQAIQESETTKEVTISSTCAEILRKPPKESTGVNLSHFNIGRHLAIIDTNEDDQWEAVALPLFPKEIKTTRHGYRGVVVCFKGVTNKEELDQLLDSGEIRTNFWPSQQNLDRTLHSMLARQYLNLDFAKSPVLYHGYEHSSPVLGETSYRLSLMIGTISAAVALLSLVFSILAGFVKSLFKPRPEPPAPTTNRAGLPGASEPSGSILDQVTSMRDRNPSV